MHSSAIEYGKRFFKAYCTDRNGILIVDIGSQNVNGSLRDLCPAGAKYFGVDFVTGDGIDVVLEDPYQLPFDDQSVDVIVCSSVFEHSQFFWLLFLEVMRVLKPEGIFYLNAPSNGCIHRYPVDCWRFYPDSGLALVAWAERNGYAPALLESFIGLRDYEGKDYKLLEKDDASWNDFVAIFIKEKRCQSLYHHRVIKTLDKYVNAYCDSDIKTNPSILTDDFLLINTKKRLIDSLNRRILERDEVIDSLNRGILERDEVINELTSSLRWKITQPFRDVVNRFYKKSKFF